MRSGVQNDVRFLGFVPIEVLRIFYDEAKVFVFPSLYEGFGLPPLEAMAHGTPVVTSNVSSLPEVVGNAAVLVNPENVFEIMRALHRVLMDKALRDRMKERGYKQAAKFSWETSVRRMLETLTAQVARTPTAGTNSEPLLRQLTRPAVVPRARIVPRRDVRLGLLQQRLAGRQNGEFVQLGGDAGAVGIGFGGGQALAQLDNFFFAGTAPANLRPAAGC